jgi:hypothetical protein
MNGIRSAKRNPAKGVPIRRDIPSNGKRSGKTKRNA